MKLRLPKLRLPFHWSACPRICRRSELAALSKSRWNLGTDQVGRLRHTTRSNDPVEQKLHGLVPGREDCSRRTRLGNGSARVARGHGTIRSHVATDDSGREQRLRIEIWLQSDPISGRRGRPCCLRQKDNPVGCLTLQQLNRIFSSTRRAAFGGNIGNWGDVGLTGDWANKPTSRWCTLSGARWKALG